MSCGRQPVGGRMCLCAVGGGRGRCVMGGEVGGGS